jgi:hypothetical protein
MADGLPHLQENLLIKNSIDTRPVELQEISADKNLPDAEKLIDSTTNDVTAVTDHGVNHHGKSEDGKILIKDYINTA